MMNQPGKSDKPIVPEKSSNKARTAAAERMEGRGLAPRELGTAKRVPDTEPERRAQCAGTSTGYSKKE